ncbi:tetratricopeptide repeat protein [Clostridium sp. B9]|uniref:tetratricopeptide repeat protein n=1 Tax=Clostridium sp. B9 TaxID=3423224 RepID=UPI003D2EF54E
MSKYDKKLKKALAQFEKGNYEEALDICEKVLDKDYNNEEALLIEGRALEKLERISDAVVSWKINAEYNNNEEARKKLDKFNNIDEKKLAMSTIFSETMKDEIKAKLQEEAQKEFSKQLEKREHEVEEIKVTGKNEQAPVIEIKKETPEVQEEIKIEEVKAFEPKKEEASKISNVTKVDFTKKDEVKEDKTEEPRVISTPSFANENSNSKKSNKKNKKTVKFVAIAVSGVIVLSLAYGIAKNMNSTSAAGNNSTVADGSNTSEDKTNNNATDNSANKDNSIESKDTNTFKAEDLNKAIEGKNYSAIANILSTTPKDKVPADALDTYTKAENLMKEEGVKELYLKGSDLFKEKKYEEALKDFESAYTYAGDSYLRPHLIYFMGTSYENLDKNTEAIKYFQEYLSDYKAKPDAEDVMYTPQCMYNLAVLYNEEGNKAEAKKYAQEIEDNYPNSMFYNDVTKNIIYG